MTKEEFKKGDRVIVGWNSIGTVEKVYADGRIKIDGGIYPKNTYIVLATPERVEELKEDKLKDRLSDALRDNEWWHEDLDTLIEVAKLVGLDFIIEEED